MRCPNCEEEITVYRNPVPTVDIIMEYEGKIVLIERKNPPLGWAIPGGFVDYGESFEHAAEREAMEECGVDLYNLRQFHTYSEPDRDPRQHTASTVFIAEIKHPPIAGDDAAKAQLFTKETLPDNIAFDHLRILEDYYQNIRRL